MRRLPPIAQLTVGSLALVVIGGILMASYVPRQPPLAAPAALTAVSAALTLTSGFLLSRLEQFAWPRFFLAFRWALLAYVISAAMIGFAFVRDHTRGAPLALVIVMLVIFALDVPVVIAFTVARYSSPPYASS
jgi:lipopolysaccharide export LptBFGC system permease protein LptF